MTVASEIEYAIACLDEVQKNLAMATLHLQIAQKSISAREQAESGTGSENRNADQRKVSTHLSPSAALNRADQL